MIFDYKTNITTAQQSHIESMEKVAHVALNNKKFPVFQSQ